MATRDPAARYRCPISPAATSAASTLLTRSFVVSLTADGLPGPAARKRGSPRLPRPAVGPPDLDGASAAGAHVPVVRERDRETGTCASTPTGRATTAPDLRRTGRCPHPRAPAGRRPGDGGTPDDRPAVRRVDTERVTDNLIVRQRNPSG